MLRKTLAIDLILPLLLALGTFTWCCVTAEYHFTRGDLALKKKNYVASFMHVRNAVRLAGWSPRYRLQVISALASMNGRAKVRIPEETWEKAHAISASASPAHPSVLAVWANHLLKKPGKRLDDTMRQLHATAAHYPETWLLDALYNRADPQKARASMSVAIGLGGKTPKAEKVARLLNMEIRKK